MKLKKKKKFREMYFFHLIGESYILGKLNIYIYILMAMSGLSGWTTPNSKLFARPLFTVISS